MINFTFCLIFVPSQISKGLMEGYYVHATLKANRNIHVNRRVKGFACMSTVWRHGWKMHILAFYEVVSLTQIKIKNGEPMPPPYI